MDKINQVKEEVKKIMLDSRSSHNWDHTERVINLALHIGKIANADLEVIELSTLLHDISRKEQDDSNGKVCHAERGAIVSREILERYGYSTDLIDKVCHCIERHRFKKGADPESIEARILYDSDKLDSLGAIGLGRAFQFSGEINSRLHNPEIKNFEDTEEYGQEDSVLREFKVKLIKIKDKLFTQEAKRIAVDRERFMTEFFNRLDKEIKGEI